MEVDIWSDIACPWCYVGKRRFETALGRFEHRDEVNVTWHAFELDPEAPPERLGNLAALLARKYGMTVEQAEASQQHLTKLAAAEGLTYHFDRARSGNTFDGHRTVALARAHGRQGEMKERLLRAYFTEGELISDHATLVRLAGEAGIPGDAVTEMLAGDGYADDVREDEALAERLGIRAVPTFVVGRALGISGAQPPEQLLELLQRGWERSVSAPTAG